jgi:hypothetical protein
MAEVTETAVLCETIILKYRLLIEFYFYETAMKKIIKIQMGFDHNHFLLGQKILKDILLQNLKNIQR